MIHLISHAQYTWSSSGLLLCCFGEKKPTKSTCVWTVLVGKFTGTRKGGHVSRLEQILITTLATATQPKKKSKGGGREGGRLYKVEKRSANTWAVASSPSSRNCQKQVDYMPAGRVYIFGHFPCILGGMNPKCNRGARRARLHLAKDGSQV